MLMQIPKVCKEGDVAIDKWWDFVNVVGPYVFSVYSQELSKSLVGASRCKLQYKIKIKYCCTLRDTIYLIINQCDPRHP